MKPKTNDELLKEAQRSLLMTVSLLDALESRQEHVDASTVKLEVTPPQNGCFENCTKCIHDEDTSEMCRLRLCVHAISELRECYKPRREEKP